MTGNLELRDGFGMNKEWFLTDRNKDTCRFCKEEVNHGFYCRECEKFWCEDCEKKMANFLPKRLRGYCLCGCVFNDHTFSFKVTCLKTKVVNKKKVMASDDE